jgi:predicted AlkP superfamily pyrophosphatase or phosphodiesterase
MNQKYGKLRRGKKQPYLDNFTQKALLETIKVEKADLILCHFTDLDSMRHESNFDSEEAKAALLRHDERLGEIMTALEDDVFYKDATLVVLGDHASKDARYALSPNAFLKALGWLKYSKNNKCEYKAIAKPCDGSTYIYAQNLTPAEIDALRGNLIQFMDYTHGVEKLIEHEEIIALGADPKALFMLEAKDGYVFEDTHTGPYVMPLEEHPYFKGQKVTAVHGYSPYKADYDTVFMLAGPRIQSGVWIDHMDLVDIAPTIAPLLNVHLQHVEGKRQSLFLRDEGQV